MEPRLKECSLSANVRHAYKKHRLFVYLHLRIRQLDRSTRDLAITVLFEYSRQ